MNINQVLQQHGLDTNGELVIVQGVRKLYESSGTVVINDIIEQLTGERIKFPMNGKEAMMLGQKIIHEAFVKQSVDNLVETGQTYITNMRANPMNNYMFIETAKSSTSGPVTMQQVSQAVNVEVAVKADGKIARGGKAVVVSELYQKYVVNGTEPITRKQMIDIICKEAGMTPAGASTYMANAKKEHGDPKGMIVTSRGK